MRKNISVATLASTYNISHKRAIADGRYTAATLLICSLIFWGAGAFFGIGVASVHASEWVDSQIDTVNTMLLRVAALVLYLFSAMLSGSYMVPEHRATWQPVVMLWVISTTFGIQCDAVAAFTLLLFVVAVWLLYRIDEVADVRHQLYTVFAIVATYTLLFPQFLLLLPFLFIYPTMCSKLNIRTFSAALLGMVTPLWVVGALLYLFPQLQPLFDGFKEHLSSFLQAPRVVVTPSMIVRLCAETAITIPAMVHFAVTATVGRIYLRRRMIFGMLLYVVLWLAGWLQPQLYTLLFIWRLPMIAMLAAYIFPALPVKTSNIYMLSTLLLWAVSAIIELWIG